MWYPGAVKKEIRPGSSDPPIIPIGVILHTDASNSASLYNYFNGPSGGIESHFHIPKKNPVEQYRSTGYEADANLKANSFYDDGVRYGFISVETQGLAGDPWTDYQLAEIKKLILWARSVHSKIQLRVCLGPFAAGIGYHTLFGSPSPWTPVAKSCPGPVRIKQFNDVLVPWLKTAAAPKPPVTITEDMIDMATPAEVAEAVELGIRNYMKAFFTDEQGTGDTLADEAREARVALLAEIRSASDEAVVAAIKENTAAVRALAEALIPKA